MPKIVRWNDDLLLEKARGVSLAYVDKLSDEFRSQFSQKNYQWGGVTRRRNGEVVGTSRDLVDTGVLRESQRVSPEAGGARISWNPPGGYAARRFRGEGYGERGRPADWVSPVIDRNPFAPYFLREWSRFSVGTSGPATY